MSGETSVSQTVTSPLNGRTRWAAEGGLNWALGSCAVLVQRTVFPNLR